MDYADPEGMPGMYPPQPPDPMQPQRPRWGLEDQRANVGPNGPADKDRMLMDYLTSQGALQPQVQEIARQRALAEQLRKTPLPGMRGGGGRVQTAANPLEFLGALGQQGVGAYQGQQADVGQKALDLDSANAFNKQRNSYGM